MMKMQEMITKVARLYLQEGQVFPEQFLHLHILYIPPLEFHYYLVLVVQYKSGPHNQRDHLLVSHYSLGYNPHKFRSDSCWVFDPFRSHPLYTSIHKSNTVIRKVFIFGDNHQPFRLGLGNQHSVKRVFVVEGK